MSADDDLAPDPFELAGTTIENKYRVASVVGDGGFGSSIAACTRASASSSPSSA
jgi:hypothetical protein